MSTGDGTSSGPTHDGNAIHSVELAGLIEKALATVATNVHGADPVGWAQIAALETASNLIRIQQLAGQDSTATTELLDAALSSARATVGAVGFALIRTKDNARTGKDFGWCRQYRHGGE